MKVYKWFIAHLTWYPVWRVTYSDGRRTRLLGYREAKSLKQCFGGKLWIDYEKGYF